MENITEEQLVDIIYDIVCEFGSRACPKCGYEIDQQDYIDKQDIRRVYLSKVAVWNRK